jgi:hypothetical protein
VTITCTGGDPGDQIAIPNCSPMPQTISSTPLTCTGAGDKLGNDPPMTVTDPAGQTTNGTVPLVVKALTPSIPTPALSGLVKALLGLMLLGMGIVSVAWRRSARR